MRRRPRTNNPPPTARAPPNWRTVSSRAARSIPYGASTSASRAAKFKVSDWLTSRISVSLFAQVTPRASNSPVTATIASAVLVASCAAYTSVPCGACAMNAMRWPSGEIDGDCVVGSAANASTGGGCAAAAAARDSSGTSKRQQPFMAAPSRGPAIGVDAAGTIAEAARSACCPQYLLRYRAARHHDLHAAIAGAAVGRAVVGNRPRRAQARDVDRRRRNTLAYQVVAHGDGAAQRKLVVGRDATGVVRMSFDVEAQAGVRRDDSREPCERFARRSRQVGGARCELDSADLGDQAAIRHSRWQCGL